ncbi:MAG: hypothetical protein QOJ39_4032 [Candidatus Eremiobacteraeota bacterium]|jgi:hypothetical protein|nr:hypothetical protein [Candidatus Eremiobacteraeota bacterium]
MRFCPTRSTQFSTTARSPIRKLAAALLAAFVLIVPLAPARAALDIDPLQLYKQMKSVYDKGAAAGWHLADQLDYFSAVLDAGRGYELRRRDDPQNIAIKGITVDLATQLSYDPLVSNDAAEWYVRLAAQAWQNDPDRGANARAIIAKLDAERANTATLAHDADADAQELADKYPGDVQALMGQVEADLRAYNLTGDVRWRTLALQRASQSAFPIGSVPQDLGKVFFPMVDAARNAGPGYSEAEREAAKVIASHRASAHSLPVIGHVVSHDRYLVITAPADEYFGRTKLSPIGVRNELTRIGKYLDAGWGGQMTKDTVYVIDSLDDWQHQYPRDYELPRLYKRAYDTLSRVGTPEAKQAQQEVRRTLLVNYPTSTEARGFISS